MNNLIQKIAKKSTHKNYKHVSIILRGGAVLSVGYNHDKIHAERMALAKVWPNKVAGTHLISVRVTKNGMGNALPCNSCMAVIRIQGVKKITFSNSEGKLEVMRVV